MKLFLSKAFKPDIVPVAESEKSPSASDGEAGIISQHRLVNGNGRDAVSSDAQLGVQKIEATTSVWSTSHLILAYVL